MRQRILLLLLFVAGCASLAEAQWTYVADNIYGDSVRVFTRESDAKSKSDKPSFVAGKTAFKVANGDTLFIARQDSGFVHSNYLVHEEKGYKESWVPGAGNSKHDGFATVTIKGAKYLVRQGDLMLAEGGGESDWVNAKSSYNHSGLAHWYGTYTPYLLVLLCVVLAVIFAVLGHSEQLFMFLTSLFLLGAMVLEALGLYALGTDVLWILDMKDFGIGGGLWHGFLLLIASLLQYASMRIMSGGGDGDLDYKSPLFFTLAGLAVTLLMVMIDGLFIHDGKWSITIGIILMLILLVVGIIRSLAVNSQELGLIGGIAFTVFVIVWSAGIVVLAVLLLSGFFEYFFDMILFFAAFGIALGLGNVLIPITTYVKDNVLYKVYSR